MKVESSEFVQDVGLRVQGVGTGLIFSVVSRGMQELDVGIMIEEDIGIHTLIPYKLPGFKVCWFSIWAFWVGSWDSRVVGFEG